MQTLDRVKAEFLYLNKYPILEDLVKMVVLEFLMNRRVALASGLILLGAIAFSPQVNAKPVKFYEGRHNYGYSVRGAIHPC
jgi:hypothetical protein